MSALGHGLRDLGIRLYRTLAVRESEFDEPPPPVRLHLRSSAPAWALNVGVAAIALLCASLLAGAAIHWIAAIAGAAVLAIRPLPGLVQVYAAVLGAGLLLADPSPGSPSVFLLIFGVHLLVQLGSLVQGLQWSARVEWAVLVVPARRFAVVQVAAQLVAAAAAWAVDRDIHAVWLSVVAGAALALLAWWVLGGTESLHVDEGED